MKSENRPVLVYDGDCDLCRRWIARWSHVTGDRVDYVSSQETAHLFPEISPERFEVITPRDANARGCQLSIFVHDRPRELHAALKDEGVVCDFREPNVIRVAPVPLYNSFHDVWLFAQVLSRHERKAT